MKRLVTNGINIIASQPVSVYGFNYQSAESAAFTCYPTPLLGTRYCLMARPSYVGHHSEFAIVATADDTTVNITPSATANLAGSLWTNSITLQQGQTYAINSIGQSDENDVTGTLVSSDKPLAVFAGANLALMPYTNTTAGNPLVQEQLPVDSWGTQALSMGFAGRTNGDSYRVLAAYDGTVILTNGWMAGTNQAGKFIDLIIDGPVQFQANQPIQVAHFANGGDFDHPETHFGDPCMILLPPAGHYLQTNIVCTPTYDPGFDENFLNIIVAQSGTNSTFLDVTNAITSF